ncbi:MAG: CHAD domain-containing protein [Actinomycetota bacterium]|nr:CHAD domain-containing protein [Actinomycetota bacterium]
MAVTDSVNDSRHFTATYVDTEDGRLARAGVVLRRRMENGKNVWEVEIGNATRAADGGPAGPPEEILRLLTAPLLGHDLVEIAKTRTRSNGDDVETAVLEGQHVITMVSDWKPKLPKPKRRPQPKKGAPALDRFRAYVRQQVDELARHDPVARLDDDPERIHQIRVATRRARSALRTARPLLDLEWAQGLREELKWLGNELAPARDLDVLLARLAPDAAELGKPAATIVRQLEGERRRAQKQLVAALESPRYLALLGELERAADAPRARTADANLDKLARKEFGRLGRAVRALGKSPTDEALHEVRKRGKRARYSAELAGGKRAKKFAEAAKSFQDVVGDHQDAVVAEERLTALVPRAKSPEAVFAAGRLLERQQRRRQTARRSLPKAWRKLQRQGRKAWA